MDGPVPGDSPDAMLALRWPVQRLGEGLEELARRAGLRVGDASAPIVPASLPQQGEQAQGHWIEWAAQRLGLEAERSPRWHRISTACCAAPRRHCFAWRTAPVPASCCC